MSQLSSRPSTIRGRFSVTSATIFRPLETIKRAASSRESGRVAQMHGLRRQRLVGMAPRPKRRSAG